MSTVAIAGQTFTFSVCLYQIADTTLLQTPPALALGDFQRSINGGAWTNLDNLPTVNPALGAQVEVVLSVAETTAAAAGGRIMVKWEDALGGQWCSGFALVFIHAAEIDAACTVSAINGNVITAAAIATDAIDADALANSAIAEIVAAIVANAYFAGITSLADWLGALAGMTTDAATLAEINATTAGATYNNTTDSLEALRNWLSAATTISVVSVIAGGRITVRPYTTWTINISGLGSLVGRTKLWLGVKDDPATEADTASFLQVEETAGLQYINGAVGVGANATLTVTDAVAGNITITVNKSQTGIPPRAGRVWQVKMGIAAGVDTVVSEGEFNVGQTVTRTTA